MIPRLSIDFFKRVVSETNQYHQFSCRKVIALLYDTADEWEWDSGSALEQLADEIRAEFRSIEITRSALGVLAEHEELLTIKLNQSEQHLEEYHGEGDDYAGDPKMEVADIAYYLARLIVNLGISQEELSMYLMENVADSPRTNLIENLQAMRNLLRPRVSEKNYDAIKQCIPITIAMLRTYMVFYKISEDDILNMLHTKLGKRWK